MTGEATEASAASLPSVIGVPGSQRGWIDVFVGVRKPRAVRSATRSWFANRDSAQRVREAVETLREAQRVRHSVRSMSSLPDMCDNATRWDW